MTPVIVAMFCCTYCICVVAMWQGIDDNDGEVLLMRVCRVCNGSERGENRRKERKQQVWDLLEAKPRLMIGWRDSAGFLTLLG